MLLLSECFHYLYLNHYARCHLQLRLRMQLSAACGCKHPRLEAGIYDIELSVWCLQLPASPHAPQKKGNSKLNVHSFVFFVACILNDSCSLCSCKHPTLSCDQMQQRLREGCLLAPAGSDTWTQRPAGSLRSHQGQTSQTHHAEDGWTDKGHNVDVTVVCSFYSDK